MATITKKGEIQDAEKYLVQAIHNEHLHTVEFLLKSKAYTGEALKECLEVKNLEIVKAVVRFAHFKDLKSVEKQPDEVMLIINEELAAR